TVWGSSWAKKCRYDTVAGPVRGAPLAGAGPPLPVVAGPHAASAAPLHPIAPARVLRRRNNARRFTCATSIRRQLARPSRLVCARQSLRSDSTTETAAQGGQHWLRRAAASTDVPFHEYGRRCIKE